MDTVEGNNNETGLEVAVIGMAGRFPGARNITDFWNNLKNGVESISFFTDEELLETGIQPDLLKNSGYVKAKGVLEDIEYFDPSFFDYSPREAEFMDPQFRILHECAWHTLEHAGYDPGSYTGAIGFYVGSLSNYQWVGGLLSRIDNHSEQIGIGSLNDRDFLSTRVAYKLNLKGPAVNVQTACSTSLVAIHLACQGLLSGESDMALAGGVSVWLPKKSGYLYEKGMVRSPDGRCRAFDAGAAGTNGGDAVALVLLKRLEDARADGDNIYAVIKGSAINNDGKRKVGYTAPSVQAQAEVIKAALQMAEVEPESVTYVEAHGTGTTLGDPVEVEALKRAFGTGKRQFCAIGSLKTNMGHLDAAAGVGGFIKTVLALKHRLIPPSLHYKTPNPAIDFENSPFYVNTEAKEWKNNGSPLRAGVSSFGIGGTNAHAVLEEAPVTGLSSEGRNWKLLLLSAKTQPALERASGNLLEFLKSNPHVNLADAAYTLQVGRQAFEHRRMMVCSDVDNAIDALSAAESEKHRTFHTKEEKRPIVFMFPGLGSQYVNMGLNLYQTEPVFREEMDRCFKILEPLLGYDIKEVLYPLDPGDSGERRDLARTDIAQVLIFIFEYSLARLLMKWGIKPYAMIGYSFGEYAAACISGVFSLEDALKLVVSRGQLIEKLPAGIMLSIPLPAGELKSLLTDELSLAIDNGPSCVAAGPSPAVETLEKQLKNKKYLCMRVQTSHAIHSKMMAPILKEYEKAAGQVTFNKPQIPYVSNVTGKWITLQQAANPHYWAEHLRETVQFADGIKGLIETVNAVFVEVGPGRDLTTLIMRYIENKPGQQAINLVRNPQKDSSDVSFLLNRIGRLWLWGVRIDWNDFHSKEKRRRIPLPPYPFERQRFRPKGPVSFNTGANHFEGDSINQRKPNITDWFYIPSWKRVMRSPGAPGGELPTGNRLLFIDNSDFSSQLVDQLQKRGHHVVTVKTGAGFQKERDRQFTVNPGKGHADDYDALFDELGSSGQIPDKIIHLWSITSPCHGPGELEIEWVDKAQDLGFYSLLNIARSIGRKQPAHNIELKVVTNNMLEVTGGDGRSPGKSTILGPVKIIPAEYANIRCCNIDIEIEPAKPGIPDRLLEELAAEISEPVVAFRGFHRWVPIFEPMQVEESPKRNPILKQEGVYLITGGLGGIGLHLAEYLAKSVRARLVLTGRSTLPPEERWEEWLSGKNKDDAVYQKILKVKELRDSGAEVLTFAADVTDEEQMQKVVAGALKVFGRVNGVIHSAGLPDGEVIQRRVREASEKIMAAKLRGTLVLDRIFQAIPLDFFVYCSSTASILGGIGQVGYCAANNFLDAFAHYKHSHDNNGTFFVSINWDRWQNVGIATIAEEMHKRLTGEDLPGGFTGGEGMNAFGRILGHPFPQVVVSARDFGAVMEEAAKPISFSGDIKEPDAMRVSESVLQRPELESPYVAPGNETEQKLADIWAAFFGYEQVGIHDDFFELGGDSLKAIIVISRIHQALDVEIPLAEFFNRLTIANLVEYINHARKSVFSKIRPVEKKDYYILSSAQRRLYILQQMEKDGIGYNETQVILLQGEADKDKLEKTVRELTRRHESLRTSVQMKGDEPVQKIHEYHEMAFKIEYRELSFHGDWSMVDDMIKDFIRPFDLSQAPLFRLGLTKIREEEYITMFDIHHIVSDGVSTAIFIDDFMKLYSGKGLPPLKLQYKDYAEWQHSGQRQELIKQQEQYWLRIFSGQLPVLNLSTDHARPGIKSFEGNLINFELSRQETHILKNITKEADVTLYMALFAVFTVLLSKLSGQEDIIVGVPTAGRIHTDLEGIMGVFVNILAVRNFPAGDKTFRKFLQEVKERTLEAFNNQEYQFENLVDKVLTNRDPSRNPLFDVVFNLLNHSEFDESDVGFMGKNKGIVYNYERNISRFDINLSAVDLGERIKFNFEYCTRLFELSTIERFIEYFKAILSSLSVTIDQKVSDIKMITEQEQEELLTITPVARN